MIWKSEIWSRSSCVREIREIWIQMGMWCWVDMCRLGVWSQGKKTYWKRYHIVTSIYVNHMPYINTMVIYDYIICCSSPLFRTVWECLTWKVVLGHLVWRWWFRGLAVVDGAVSDAGKNQISVEETKLVQMAVELLAPFRVKTTGVFFW